ncbi:uncharacterized protein AMSG_11853 [Thecamonas trahens ATCC 50062]|uniref:Uncharacterized protein n=1 Tax=Thecamonas trahens ATCC 50062 TaxID=461836 RepID=A0A0L0DCV5_THETB|nr:hypothetical protein AMSG_11853 [Thecamonas trahens ATCC 50062]KNC49148.1 hypothetical protein AMSG_11853 [Thecamonas trahens ATCC 50062]|eukprot:XP_013758232.1 hypothetical protein AMSG_11853 [Thecamonas trahens ATCC 50062]
MSRPSSVAGDAVPCLILPYSSADQSLSVSVPLDPLPPATSVASSAKPTWDPSMLLALASTLADKSDLSAAPSPVFALPLFMAAVLASAPKPNPKSSRETALLRLLLHALHTSHLDDHFLAEASSASGRPLPDAPTLTAAIHGYQATVAFLSSVNLLPLSALPHLPALLASPNTSLLAVFGGQGVEYWPELAATVAATPSIRPLVDAAAAALAAAAASPQAVELGWYAEHGFDLAAWLANTPPPPTYLAFAPISFPLIGLTQLLNYAALAANLALSPTALRRHFASATGHSQGIVAAVVLALLDDAADSPLDDFAARTVDAVRFLFWIGARMQQVAPLTALPIDVIEDSRAKGRGKPTPMLSVTGLDSNTLTHALDTFQARAPVPKYVHLALRNGRNKFVVAGVREHLHDFCDFLDSVAVSPDLDQARTPFSLRKPTYRAVYLDVSGSFHSPLLEPALALVAADLHRIGLAASWSSARLSLPVYSPTDAGADLATLHPSSLTAHLAASIAVATAAPASAITHIIDFGPGRESGIAAITAANLRGRGISVLSSALHTLPLYSRSVDNLTFGISYANAFGPSRVVLPDGSVRIDTKFTRATGRPPVLVGGMTPTSAHAPLVAAIANAGYHAELAGGGLPRKAIFHDRVAQLVALLNPGASFGLNLLFLNPKQWAFQYPATLALLARGVPISHVTIAAGVPSLDNGIEILSALAAAGLRELSFKPGNVSAIHRVLAIASAVPHLTVVLQWTGGRAGGHHSFEDAHHPILHTYHAIRATPNIPYGYPPMPFDAVMIASRVMVAAEAATASPVKDLIVATPGVAAQHEWERSYDGPVGGIITVTSELGEPIHVLANRAGGDALTAALAKHRAAIISGLNDHYQKPFFPRCPRTGNPCPLSQLTYAALLRRMVHLMTDATGAWMHATYRSRTAAMTLRAVERVATAINPIITAFPALASPDAFPSSAEHTRSLLAHLAAALPRLDSLLLASQDIDYFLALCKTGGKPVNFVPLLDADIAYWFKKDSLWMSEDLSCVPDSDPQRVFVLHGPVAAAFSTSANEPVATILNSITDHVLHVLASAPSAQAPTPVPYLAGPARPHPSHLPNAPLTIAPLDDIVIPLDAAPSSLPSLSAVLDELAGPDPGWRAVALLSPSYVAPDGHSRIPNMTITLSAHHSDTALISLSFDAHASDVVAVVHHHKPGGAVVPLTLSFSYRVSPSGLALLFVNDSGHTARVKHFYAAMWFDDPLLALPPDHDPTPLPDRSFSATYTLTRDAIKSFQRAIGNTNGRYLDRGQDKLAAPLDMAIAAAWVPLMRALFVHELNVDFLRLVHLTNSVAKVAPSPAALHASELSEGDILTSVARLVEIRNSTADPEGKVIAVAVDIARCGAPLLTLTSSFLVRGYFDDYENTFTTSHTAHVLDVSAPIPRALVAAESWIACLRNRLPRPVPGHPLPAPIATIAYSAAATNDVLAFLDKHAVPLSHGADTVEFADGGEILLAAPDMAPAPRHNSSYAVASGDLNPIHVNPAIAVLANLPGTITHGMWLAANARRVLETWADNDPHRILDFAVEFTGMVLPLNKLYTQLVRVGMRNGAAVIHITTRNADDLPVLRATALVAQPRTAYLFTGQGSTELGMGMDLYASSPVARNLWDRADAHLKAKFGFSLLHIVRKNPKELTVHFHGPRGVAIRDNYRALTRQVPHLDNATGKLVFTTQALFPDITSSSSSYTFSAPQGGLLFATQFNQPALVMFEVAAYSDMVARGLVQKGAFVAGHSLGEYAAVSVSGDVMPPEELVVIVFLRGMTMQSAVVRDAAGRSSYGMVAADPSRVGPHCSPHLLSAVVDGIESATGALLQIVNYNVEGRQYVVAGDLYNLEALSRVLSALKRSPESPIARLVRATTKVTEALRAEHRAEGSLLSLSRGSATIPLRGIDVPFHSKLLRPGVAAFRAALEASIAPVTTVAAMEGVYIPNVTAVPFAISRSYCELVATATGSEILADVLAHWDTWASHHAKPALGRKLLIELLSYQFASPVQWIKTQEVLFNTGVRRIIEIGPMPTLSTLASRTLTRPAFSPLAPLITVVSYASHTDAIYLLEGNRVEPPPLADVTGNSTLRELAGGKSAMQNEVVGDLGKEFASASTPDNAVEMPLSAFAAAVAPSYKSLGKVSIALLGKLASRKLPGGFGASKMRAALNAAGLDGGLVDNALVRALAMEPPSRLPDDAAANAWLASVAASYAAAHGLSLPAPAVAAPPPTAPDHSTSPPAAAVPDAPPAPEHVLRVLVATKSKKSLADAAPTASIRDLAGGKSALQNEIVGELGEEFGPAPASVDNLADMPLAAAAAAVGPAYSKLGKVSSNRVRKMLSTKIALGYDAAAAHLASAFGLGPGRIDSVLVHGLLSEPASRLASQTEAHAWLDATAQSYASFAGIPLASPAAAAAAAAPGAGLSSAAAAAVLAQLAAFTESHAQLIRNLGAAHHNFLGIDSRAADKTAAAATAAAHAAHAELDWWRAEHGDAYADGIVAAFAPAKVRVYDSAWNWARVDFVELFLDLISANRALDDPLVDARLDSLRNRGGTNLAPLVECYAAKARDSAACPPGVADKLAFLATTLRHAPTPPRAYLHFDELTAPHVSISPKGAIVYEELPRHGVANLSEYVASVTRGASALTVAPPGSAQSAQVAAALAALESLLAAVPHHQVPDQVASQLAHLRAAHADATLACSIYHSALHSLASGSVSFAGLHVLVTGCGSGSIGLECVKHLLAGGARVVATTSSYSLAKTTMYRNVYRQWGAAGASLILVPFNQGSLADVNALVDYIYSSLAMDLDVILPFAAISENGRDLASLDSKSELAHRIMLTNLERLLGAVKAAKDARQIETRPACVVLPLSPNHGAFGHDGLYSESKIGLEALLAKCVSEGWGHYLSVVGAVIGWTRGTGLMSGTNLVAPTMENDYGCRTFSPAEMAFNILALIVPAMKARIEEGPLVADLSGGMGTVPDLHTLLRDVRADLEAQAATARALAEQAPPLPPLPAQDRACFDFAFPNLPTEDTLAPLRANLHGMLDLESIVCVVGYGEIGPWGNARTRWDMEQSGELSLEGCIELAWLMGLITYDPAQASWVDATTRALVADLDVKASYEDAILAHAGIRLVEPELFDGYSPHAKSFLRQVVVTNTLGPVEVASPEEATAFKAEHGDAATIFERGSTWFVQLEPGSVVYVPKALRFDRAVAGQIPTGWDPARLGVPQDIIAQVDPVTLYLLTSTAEALLTAGITDPYELYNYVHVSQVGNSIGGGMGGMRAIRRAHRDRLLDHDIPSDTLQEQLINVAPAWINMLLLSASGPIKTPVAACATAAESVDIAVETLLAGKAKVMFVGGFDDFGEESSYEFAQMGATSNSDKEFAQGRDPREMCRPATTSRGGFMESQGGAVQMLTTAALAIEMGLPIHAVLAWSATATDKEGRSVPAPGQGILTAAREVPLAFANPMLDIDYRRAQLDDERARIAAWLSAQRDALERGAQAMADSAGPDSAAAYLAERSAALDAVAHKMTRAALKMWNMEFYLDDPSVAPLRGALAVFGLDINDVDLISFHGTGTALNDTSESTVNQIELDHLGRHSGNPVFTVFQKWLTGHPKAPAAGWMLNGVLQIMASSIVPGNGNLDNVDPALAKNSHLLYLDRPIKLPSPPRAALLKSFGFGQAGASILVLNPMYVFAALSPAQMAAYSAARLPRATAAYRYGHEVLTSRRALISVKNEAPYSDRDQTRVYLNPTPAPPATRPTAKAQLNAASSAAASSASGASTPKTPQPPVRGVGVDVEDLAEWHARATSSDFLDRNFTPDEVSHCTSRPSPPASFAGRWCAKEAVLKALNAVDPEDSSISLGPAAPLRDIEISTSASGAPVVILHGAARDAADRLGIATLSVSISHSDTVAPASPGWLAASTKTVAVPEFPALKSAGESTGESASSSSSKSKSRRRKRRKGEELSMTEQGRKMGDPYEALGLPQRFEATQEEIEEAYRYQVVVTHPDKNGGLGDAPFVAVQEAYDVLINVDTRRQFESQYDVNETMPKPETINKDNFFDVLEPIIADTARFSMNLPVPLLGDMDTPYDDVDAFYEFWTKFDSWRDFRYYAKYTIAEISNAEDREERRWMEQQNKAEAKKLKKRDNQRIYDLVQLAKAKDPRIARRRAERKAAKEAERQAKLDAKAAKKAAAEAKKAAAEAEARAEEEAKKAEANKAKAGKAAAKKRKKIARRNMRKLPESFPLSTLSPSSASAPRPSPRSLKTSSMPSTPPLTTTPAPPSSQTPPPLSNSPA